jgi:hypothetical protein
MKYVRLFFKCVEIATFVIPIIKGIGKGVYQEYKKSAKKVKDIWKEK